MAAPSLISVNVVSGAYDSTTSPQSTASFAVQSGDILIAVAFIADDGGNAEVTIANTVGSNPTWVQRQETQPNNANQCYSSLWSGVAPASENITVTFTRTGNTVRFGGEVHVWRGSDGLGNTATNNNTTNNNAPTVNITTTQIDSGLSAASTDWNAAGAATWGTGPGAVVERTDFTNASFYSVHTATYADVGAVGAKTVAQTTPTTQRYQIVVAEVKGSAGGTAHQGNATFAGAGSFSADAVKSKLGAANFSGAGNLSVLANQRAVIAASFGGVGSVSVAAIQRLAASAIFAGSGSLSARADNSKTGAATFAGAGSLSANALNSKTGAATFAGAGNLTASVTARLAAQATFAGTGSISALAVGVTGDVSEQIWSVEGELFEEAVDDFVDTGPQFGALPTEDTIEARFNGAGNLTVAAQLRMQIEARFNGAGSLAADATQSGLHSGEATFAGAGNLSASAVQRHAQGAVFEGAGSLSGAVRARLAASAIFAGAGGLSAQALQSGLHLGEARFSGSGNMTVAALQRMAARATFAGAGSLQVATEQRGKQQIAATFSGAGSLSVDTTVISTFKFGEATFNGAGNVIPLARARMMIAANMNGAGSMSVLMTGGVIPRVPTGGGSFVSGVVYQRPADPAPTRTTHTPLRSRNTG